MKLTIKGSSNKVFEIEIGEEATVQDLKNSISENQGITASSIRLIYSGKVLADPNPLSSFGIKDGSVVHMVVAKARPAQPAQSASVPEPNPIPSTPPPQNQQQPNSNPFAAMGGFPGMEGMDFGAMMNNPMVQQMMNQVADNPDMMIEMMRSNPMFANNPMIQPFLNNPELLRQQMQMFRQMTGQGSAANTNPQPSTTSTTNQFSSLFGQQAPAPTRSPIDNVLLQHLLEAQLLPSHQQLLNNAEIQRGLNMIQQGIQICRRNGLMLFNNVPNIDQSIAQHIVSTNSAPTTTTQTTSDGNSLSPEQRFGPQLEQLSGMGFNDRQRNIEALIACHGNVQQAVDWLFTH